MARASCTSRPWQLRHKEKRLKFKILLWVLLMWSVVAGAAESTGTPVNATFTSLSQSAALLPNPEKGKADYAGGDFVGSFDQGSAQSAFNAGTRLAFCQLDISAFRTTAISSTWLNTFQTNLNTIRSMGMKCMMVFAYGFGGNPDTDITHILQHVAQLKPYLLANADVIPFLKNGFIGQYGEWWGSSNGNSCGYAAFTTGGTAISCTTTDANFLPAMANRASLRDALLSSTNPQLTSLGARYPTDIQRWFPTALTAQQAFTGSKQSRIGMHNDCALGTGGGNQDSGTWLDAYGAGLSQSQFQSYVAQIAQFVAYFGELSNSCGTLQTDCPTGAAYMAKYHAAAFKIIGSDGAPFVTGWTNGGCLNQMLNQMGYWVQLDSVSHQGTAVHGQSVTFNVGLRNLGNGPILTPRKLTATLCTVAGCGSGNVVTCAAHLDMRAVPSQGTSSFNIVIGGVTPCTIPNAGTYQVYLSIPDATATNANVRAFKIQFGNSNSGGQVWDNTNGWMSTGTTIVVS